MLTLVEYHKDTEEIALFNSEKGYRIGRYSNQLTHQNSPYMYYYIDGYFQDLNEAVEKLHTTDKNAF